MAPPRLLSAIVVTEPNVAWSAARSSSTSYDVTVSSSRRATASVCWSEACGAVTGSG